MIYSIAAVVTAAAFIGVSIGGYLLIEKTNTDKSISNLDKSVNNLSYLGESVVDLNKMVKLLRQSSDGLDGTVGAMGKKVNELSSEQTELKSAMLRFHDLDPMVFRHGVDEIPGFKDGDNEDFTDGKRYPEERQTSSYPGGRQIPARERIDVDEADEGDDDVDSGQESSRLQTLLDKHEGRLAELETKLDTNAKACSVRYEHNKKKVEGINSWVKQFSNQYNKRYQFGRKLIHKAPQAPVL